MMLRNRPLSHLMTSPFQPITISSVLRFTAMASTSLLLLSSCKKSTSDDGTEPEAAIRVATLHQNNLSKTNDTSSFILSQVHSPVHWQPWSKQVFADATSEKKTVFALIGSGTDSHSQEILKKINRSPATCAALNNSHANILIDANQHPDLAFLVATLNLNTGNTVSKTQLVWFSHEGVPISWTSINNFSELNLHEIIIRMSTTVDHLWQDDPAYVLKNSSEDLKRRLKGFTPTPKEGEEDSLINIRASRQAGSMFDPVSSSIDNLAGLSIARYTQFMALAATHPDISDRQSKNFINIASRTTDSILIRGLIDPLDGGIFSGVQQSTIALPVFTKTLSAQTRSMEALYTLYQQTKNQTYFTAAESIRTYLEKNLILPDGGYALGITYAGHGIQDNPCIWSLEEIEAALTEDETKLCVQAFDISGLGNIPLIDDRNRTYFRKNTLSWKTSMDKLATLSGLSPEELKTKLESITKKLGKLRTERTTEKRSETLSTLGSMAALASAYTTAYRVAGDEANLKKAIRILTHIQTNFTHDSGELKRARYNGQLLNAPAKGIDYASTCKAALDLHEVSQDPAWLEWAAKIHQQMNANFANGDFTDLLESGDSENPHPLKIRNFITLKPIDNNATWGIAYSNARRLALRLGGDNLTTQADNIEKRIKHISKKAPLANIDYLTADALLHLKTVYFKAPVSAELLKAALPHACQLVAVTTKGTYPKLGDAAAELTAGNAVVLHGNKNLGTASNAEDLDKLLR